MQRKTVLLVDDDDNTLAFTRYGLKHFATPPALHYVANGLQAMQYLEGYGSFADRQIHLFPDLILLDLKMPGMDGFEFLSWLRSHPTFRALPVVVLTGSKFQPDLARARQLGANAFLEKSAELPDFRNELSSVLLQFLPVSEAAANETGKPITVTINSGASDSGAGRPELGGFRRNA